MKQLISRIDQFGVEQKLQIHQSSTVQKSIFGGIMTIILYGASLAYFLSELIDWIEINKLPRITSFQKQIDQAETVQLNGRYFQISSVSLAGDNDIDPFDPQNIILFPQVKKYTQNPIPYEYFSMLFEQKTLQSGKKKYIFFLENEQIIGSPANGDIYNDQIYFEIEFDKCFQNLLPQGMKCANESLIQNYSQQRNYIQISFLISEYDTKSKQVYKIEKYQQKLISMNIVQLYQFNLQISNLKVDDGILFNNFNLFSFVSDFSIETQQVDPNHYDYTTPLIIQLNLGQVKKVILIEYSKISEILANTGSIISWILWLSFIVIKYNDRIALQTMINEVIKLYYPDFENLKIKTNWKGQCLEAKINNKQYDEIKIQQLLTRLKFMAHNKINYQNIQQELARLQFLLIQSLGLNFVKNNCATFDKIENILDTCCQKVKNQPPSSDSVINLRDNSEFELKQNQQQISEMEYLDSTIGLFGKKSQLEKGRIGQDPNDMNDKIYPKEEYKQEEVSRLNSQR